MDASCRQHSIIPEGVAHLGEVSRGFPATALSSVAATLKAVGRANSVRM